ncbi:MAG: 30S ribosomal protein S2 [Nanoarchaeota archaeon]|nr:30S ribosomal protein S2 [Nanoarchaeota archaeon]
MPEKKETSTGKKEEKKQETKKLAKASIKKIPKKEEKVSVSKKTKLEELKEKAKALEKKFEEARKVDIREEVKGKKEEKKDMLVPIDDYLKSSVHLGTRVITPQMRKYVYRRRADGLAVFNTALLDDKIREGAEYLSKFDPEEIVIVCKREAGWKAVTKFAEILDIKYFTKKYPAGTLTNIELEDFFEKNLMIICDPWLDKNALVDANKIKIPVLSICDTNNFTKGIEQVIPGNNKSAKSLGMILYLLAKLYIESKKLDVKSPTIQEFVEDWDELQVARK